MLDYLVTGRARRELLRLLWGRGAAGSVSDLSRIAKVPFSAAHRELAAMRAVGLARAERKGTLLLYRAATDHLHAGLLRHLAAASGGAESKKRVNHDEQVRAWFTSVGAPLGAAETKGPAPPIEQVVGEALSLSHRDATVARVFPLVLWRQRDELNFERLFQEANRRDERQALGYFLELAGELGGDSRLVKEARRLHDGRRKKARVFFAGPHGTRALAATRRNTPREALRWGYLMNMGVDSFRSTFEKFARP